jgi:hypothetical protein
MHFIDERICTEAVLHRQDRRAVGSSCRQRDLKTQSQCVPAEMSLPVVLI